MQKSPSERLKELELKLPPAPKPVGVYRPILVVDKFLYVSQGPVKNDGSLMIGKAGEDMNTEEAKIAARQVGWTNNAFHHNNTFWQLRQDQTGS